MIDLLMLNRFRMTLAVALTGALLGALFGRNGDSSIWTVAAAWAAAFGLGSYLSRLLDRSIENALVAMVAKVLIGGMAGYLLSLITPASALDAISLIWAVL